MKTLDEAYIGWQKQERNRQLYMDTRDVFRKAWFTIPTNKPCEYYTKEVLREALASSSLADVDKPRAASVMIHVLTWANDMDEENPKPCFSFSELTALPSKKTAVPEQHVREEPKQKAADQPKPEPRPVVTVTVVERAPAEKRGKRQERLICQIDPGTMKVIKIWPHGYRIKEELGICNVVRAIERCGLAGDYYWSYADDANTFKDRLAERKRQRAEAHRSAIEKMRAHMVGAEKTEKPKKANQQQPKHEPKKPTSQTHLVKSDEEIQELIRNKEHIVAVEPSPRERAQAALKVFTDQELFDEIERRGWFGNFSRTEVVTIGRKE